MVDGDSQSMSSDVSDVYLFVYLYFDISCSQGLGKLYFN